MNERETIRRELKETLGPLSYPARITLAFHDMLRNKQYARAAVYLERVRDKDFLEDIEGKNYNGIENDPFDEELVQGIVQDNFGQFEAVAEALHRYSKLKVKRNRLVEDDLSLTVTADMLDRGMAPIRAVNFYSSKGVLQDAVEFMKQMFGEDDSVYTAFLKAANQER